MAVSQLSLPGVRRELPWVSAQTYGATADGSTDDTAAIHAAIDALPSTGGVVLLPKGTYICACRVTKQHVTLMGEGWQTILKTPAGATTLDNDCPVRLLADYCRVTNLQIDGNRSNNAAIDDFTLGRQADGVGIYANYCEVDHCYIHNKIGHGVIVWNEQFLDPADGETELAANEARVGCVIADNLIQGLAQRAAIDIASTANTIGQPEKVHRHWQIVRNRVDDMPIVVHTGFDGLIQGNVCTGGGISVHTGSRRVAIRDNVVSDTTGIAIVATGTSVTCYDITCEGNHVYNSAGVGIEFYTVIGGLMSKNQVVTTGSGASGLSIRNTTNITAVGNYIKEAGARAIYILSTAENVSVIGNHIVDAGSFAIEMQLGSGGQISGNTITGGTGGIVCTNTSTSGVRIVGNVVSTGANIAILWWGTKCEINDNHITTTSSADGIRMRSADNSICRNRLEMGSGRLLLDGSTPTNAWVTGNRIVSSNANPISGSPTGLVRRNNLINNTWEESG